VLEVVAQILDCPCRRLVYDLLNYSDNLNLVEALRDGAGYYIQINTGNTQNFLEPIASELTAIDEQWIYVGCGIPKHDEPQFQ